MARTYRRLWETFISFENLNLAWRNARRGKRRKPAVAAFEWEAESHLFDLQDELRAGTYQHRPYHTFVVTEHGKRRLISAAHFRDWVVHHALYNVLAPIWERRFHGHSYACRPGKGTHRAVDRCQQLARRYPYVLQCDIKQFFPSIDHAILRTTLSRHLADRAVLNVVDRVLESGDSVLRSEYTPVLFPGDDLFALGRPRGLPIGNLTSQFWANVYLHPLDLWIAHELRCAGYVRYCDDFLLFGADKAQLHQWRDQIIAAAARLRLTLHEPRAQISPTRCGIPWLGWVVYPDQRLLKQRCGIAFRRRYQSMKKAYRMRRITLERLAASVQGWAAHVAHGNTFGLRRALFEQPV